MVLAFNHIIKKFSSIIFYDPFNVLEWLKNVLTLK